ncbi:MAG: hypothetical protein IT445_08155 [Phycisphaeraceae bacterium]|nr:hypothetical protein [Phycisphaeraceae bacterium]
MSNRVKLIAAATAAAAIVLLVTLLAGPDAAPRRPKLTQQELEQLDLGSGDSGKAQTGHFRMPDPDSDRVTWLYWDRITPLDSPGLNDVEKPVTRIVFSPQRVVEITANRGIFQLNDQQNQLQRGSLTGHVVLRLMETADGSDVDLHSDRDVQLRLELEQAEFDLELGELISESPLRVTGPRVDFAGHGLSIHYNQLRDRIDQLVVDHIEKFTLRQTPSSVSKPSPPQSPATPVAGSPASGSMSEPSPPGRGQGEGETSGTVDNKVAQASSALTPTPPHPRNGEREQNNSPPAVQPRRDKPAAPPQPSKAEPTQSQPPTFYCARFEDNVVIDATQRGAHMTGDYLDATFRLESRSDSSPKLVKPRPAASADAPPKVKTPRPESDKPKPAAPAAADDEPVAARQPDEVRIQCSGRMIMKPELQPDQQLLDDPDSVLLALIGARQPVSIRTDEGETVTGQRVDYVTSTGRVRAFASGGASSSAGDSSTAMPLKVQAPQLGELTGKELLLDPSLEAGYVLGPGSLITQTSQEQDQPLRITWRDRLDLTFFVDRRGNAAPARLAAIRTAAFHGDAAVEHPDLRMSADTLSAEMKRSAGQRSRLTGIDAAGHAVLTARDSAKDQRIAINSDNMRIDVITDEQGKEQPSSLHATGNVVAQQPGMVMHTNQLDARMGPQDGEQRLTLLGMDADGGVTVEMDDPAVKLSGSRMALDAVGRQMELFGASGDPARAIRDDGELRGAHLVMEDKTQTVHVIGPGAFTFNTGKQTDDQQPRKLTVTWAQSMLFDQTNGFAHFVDDVVSVAETQSDQSTLSCADLRLNFEKVADSTDEDDQTGGLQIRTATADGNPVFLSRSFTPEAPDTDLTRLRLEGPLMTFDNSPGVELIQVIGQGRMLIEDYRPQEAGNSKSEIRNSKLVQVTGRGQTLFTWNRQLTIDSARRDMLMEGAVQMVHRPTGEQPTEFGEVVTMQCSKLLADFQDAPAGGGWSALGGEQSAKLSMHMIVADRDVMIQQAGRKVTCDRMTYLGEKNTVELAAARDKQVRIEDPLRPVPLVSQAFEWNLDRDEFNVTRPGALTVPLPR